MSEPLRILMVCPQFRPLIGGYERAAERLSHGLIAAGHRVEVVTERRDRAWPAVERDGGLVIRRHWCVPRAGLHTATSLLAFAWFLLLRGRRHDVFHVHQYGVTSAVCIAMAGLLRRPVVLKLTNTGPMGIAATVAQLPLPGLGARLHRRVHACIATSERAISEAREFGIPADRIHRIPNTLDTDVYRPAEPEERARVRAELGVGGRFVAVAVGRVTPQKDHGMLVDAFARLAAGNDRALLALLGDGPAMQDIRDRVAESPAKDAIRLLGRVEAPLAWYQAADVYVLPSIHEGLSNSLMEALGCGLPIVTTRVSGAEDVLAEAPVGRMVEVGDTEAFADEMAALAADEEARAVHGATARRYALEHYALAAVARATGAVYAKLLGRSGAQ